VARSEPSEAATLARLQSIGLVSNVDRFVGASLLVTLTRHFHAPLTQVALVTSGHLVAYGLCQLPWSAVLSRLGPVAVMRIALLGAGVSACLAALAPNLEWLILARVVGGSFLAAAVPAALLYVGTRIHPDGRQRGFEGIVASNGLGIILAVGIAILATAVDEWRLGYLASGVMLTLSGLLVGTLRRPRTTDLFTTKGTANSQPPVVSDRGHVGRTARAVGLVFVEGMVIVGAVLVLPALAEGAGQGRTTSAATVAVYGLAMSVTGLVTRRLPPLRTLATRVRAASLLICAPVLVLAVWPPLPALLTGAALLGAAWSVLHPALQDAATQSWPSRTPMVLALFVSALFLGSAGGSQLFASLAEGPGRVAAGLTFVVGAALLQLEERLTRRFA